MRKTVLLVLVAFALASNAVDVIDLAGIWQFELDRGCTFSPDQAATDSIALPGTTDTNRKGDKLIGKGETTHLSRPYSYKGRAWYRRTVEIPHEWQGKPVYLLLERTKPSHVYVDGTFIGSSSDISTPQEYGLGDRLKPGLHVIDIMIDNGSGVPEQIYASSHAYTEDTQTNWNGIIGKILLSTQPFAITPVDSIHPSLRDFHADGSHFYANGKRVFLRGRHDACVWPLTGHVAMDIESWRKYMKVCQDYGLNHIRFHSWCPPEAAFQAADEAGIVLQPELPFWGSFDKSDTTLMSFLHKEGENILRCYGHHPSFRLFALGNELWGDVDAMKEFTDDFRKIAPDRLYTFGSNYYLGYQGVKPGMDFFVTCRVGGGEMVVPQGEGLIDLGNIQIPLDKVNAPQKLRLELAIDSTQWHNGYDIWVYPENIDLAERRGSVIVAHDLSPEIRRRLENGADVLWMPDSSSLTVGPLFQTDYWNYRMFKTICEKNNREVSPGTLGILADPAHPLLRDFPNDGHSDWQWWAVVKNSHPFILDNTSSAYRPIIQVIDNIERNHKLGLAFEFAVGKGRLLVVMADLDKASQYPEGRQFYASVLSYMNSSDFNPATRITLEELHKLFTSPVAEGKIGALENISPY